MTVDKALDLMDQTMTGLPKGVGEDWVGVVLAAEVRRLRAMLEPTPDARELADNIIDQFYIGDNELRWHGPAIVGLIAAHDARLLDEAAERGVAWLKTLHHEPEEGLPWSGKIRRMQDLQVQTLRAAIKGVAHE